MDQRSLILLGLLMTQSQHGYQINEFIENNLCMITNMKKPTAYATLDKLSKNGFIDVRNDRAGNRPPRKVYSINDKGRKYFLELLRSNLSSAEVVHYEGDIGIMFMDYLPAEDIITALTERLKQNEKILASLIETPHHGTRETVNLAVQHRKTMLKAEIAFLKDTLDKLSDK
ncbi:MAG: PadR family transcriptional regulator [Bacillus sp. (in: firmicutes)]